MYTLFSVSRGSLSLFARGGGGSSSFSSPMFSTTSSSSFQQLASPRPLSPRPSLLYSSKVSFRCLRLQSNTPSRRRLETTVFGRDFPSFLSTSTVSFSSSRRLLARRSTPSSSTRPKCSPLPCSASRKSRQLYLPARPSSSVVCAESCVPSEETTEDPVASDAPSKTSFFSRFFRSFRSFRSLRLLELNMFFETRTLVLFLLAAWICSCTSSRATSSSSSKCKRPPKRVVVPGIFFLSLSLSLSLSLFRAK